MHGSKTNHEVQLYKDIKFAELEKLDPNERKNEKINLLKDLVSKL